VVQFRLFSEMLATAIRKYQNRAIEAAQVIEELIGLAKQMRESAARGEKLHLTDDEVAFYDALETNDGAVKVLVDETLRTIARELVGLFARTRQSIGPCVKTCVRTCGYW
jgi:type I restriction enzyme R subunit